MKKKLFTYVVLLHEYTSVDGGKLGSLSATSMKEYKDTKVIIPLTTELAASEKDLVFKITRLIPEEHAGEPDNIEILVRPF